MDLVFAHSSIPLVRYNLAQLGEMYSPRPPVHHIERT
jgi:hypothetical protein